jgi:outer membrane cobalamin receptor
LLLIGVFLPALLSAQTGTVKGTVIDAGSGEPLIGVNILYASGKGTVTDLEGNYQMELPYGKYDLQVSYVGYVSQTLPVNVSSSFVRVDMKLKNVTLSEVEVVADIARTRETPVAFTSIPPKKIEEQLASQDIPLLLNKTPGVYATQQGGGDGDSRINIRGFNQRNVAVMVDGIPVNDMENGWVYWSNWFGLDAVTRNIQVQRGLGASKLVIPSVGGTVNILTQGIEDKARFSFKQEYGSDAFLRSSIGWNSGQMKNGWGVTLAGSYKRGNGWVDETWTEGWFYFGRIDKKIGRHLVSLSAMGAPQQHGQRSYKKSIATFDKDYAAELGVDTAGMPASKGLKFNENWGWLQRVGEAERQPLSERKNYYHKPLISLRDFWNINEKTYWSNILYVSLGKGGGTGTTKSDKYGNPGSSSFALDENGQVDFQSMYNLNDTSSDGRSRGVLRSSVNDHYWYGWLSTVNYKINELWEFSGGLDLRSYKGEHYMMVYDLLGGDYFLDNVNQNTDDIVKEEGDKMRYHDAGLIRWGGLFGLLKWRQGNWSAFINLSGSGSGYKRIDYYLKQELEVGDTTLLIGYNDTIDYNGNTYTRDSEGLQANQTGWKWFPGFTIKGGVNYNLSEKSNLFANVGYLSKAPRFNNVYYYSNVEFTDPENEKVMAFELGYSLYGKNISLDVNGYATIWQNKPADRTSSYQIDDQTYQVNINGMDARHIGLEAEFNHEVLKNLSYNLLVSLGDWIWTSSDTARVYIDQQYVDDYYFDASGVHVGDAAQIQLSGGIRWEIIRDLYLNGTVTYFTKNFSEFDPISLSPDNPDNPPYLDEDGNPKESWQIPDYFLVDLNAGYTWRLKKFNLDFRASVLNLLNSEYISDAQNNDPYSSGGTQNFDAQSAGVFFGLGRRFNISVRLSF